MTWNNLLHRLRHHPPAAASTCLLCGQPAVFQGLFVPSDSVEFGGGAAKQRVFVYTLCGACVCLGERRPLRAALEPPPPRHTPEQQAVDQARQVLVKLHRVHRAPPRAPLEAKDAWLAQEERLRTQVAQLGAAVVAQATPIAVQELEASGDLTPGATPASQDAEPGGGHS